VEDPDLSKKGIRLSVLRLDRIHPVISGNKWFKLQYNLREAINLHAHTLLSFGGPYSNHLLATAAAACLCGMKSIGIVRGEAPPGLNLTLNQAAQMGMDLHFIARREYDFAANSTVVPDCFAGEKGIFLIPPAAHNVLAVKGCEEILHPELWPGSSELTDFSRFSHILAAAGSGTTLAGLLQSAWPHQQIIGIPVMGQGEQLLEPVKKLLTHPRKMDQLHLITDAHFGGFGRVRPDLLSFVNYPAPRVQGVQCANWRLNFKP